MKKLARVIVLSHYNIFPPQGEKDPKLTTPEYQNRVKDNIGELLRDGNFMHNGKDSNVRLHLVYCNITD